MSVTEIVQAVLTAARGGAIVIAGLAGWLGTVRAKRITRNQKFLLDRINLARLQDRSRECQPW